MRTDRAPLSKSRLFFCYLEMGQEVVCVCVCVPRAGPVVGRVECVWADVRQGYQCGVILQKVINLSSYYDDLQCVIRGDQLISLNSRMIF